MGVSNIVDLPSGGLSKKKLKLCRNDIGPKFIQSLHFVFCLTITEHKGHRQGALTILKTMDRAPFYGKY
jgi:hypothetical protein